MGIRARGAGDKRDFLTVRNGWRSLLPLAGEWGWGCLDQKHLRSCATAPARRRRTAVPVKGKS